ncbi:MAG: hypothetical protein BWZ03_00071 [bacterium ADurb.BinA186]|nr:MAG: hypothetical protein BWZ03_00071 [bacterium ADurb.BinA186]
MNPESLKQARLAAYEIAKKYKGLFPHKGMSEEDFIKLIHYCSWMPPSFTLQLLDHVDALEKKLEKAREAFKFIDDNHYESSFVANAAVKALQELEK